MSAITAADIRAAMLARWASPEYAIMWEVAPSTGLVAGRVRYADAVIMSLWPSRGLDLHGVEIKVTRSDWRREAADPTKAERIAAYCDFWWVHVGPGVIDDLSDVPMAWGVREFDGTSWKTLREATRTGAKPCDRGFLAALLRRADESMRSDARRAAEKMIAADREAYEKRVKDAVEQRTRRNTEALRLVEAFEQASGLSLGGEWYSSEDEARQIGALVKALRCEGFSGWSGIVRILNSIRDAADSIEAAVRENAGEVAALMLPERKPAKRRRAA